VPKTQVVFYREVDGAVSVLEWFDGLPAKAQDKCRVRIQRLSEMGHELRRPEADLLRDGIYELRVRLGTLTTGFSTSFTAELRRSWRMG
jgi:phage-related protein